MIIKLNKSYKSIHGLPVIHSVDTDIFAKTYYKNCMECSFCNDQCCSYGTIIDMENVKRVLKYADELEKFTGMKRSKWFYPKKRSWDSEYPGHIYTRTSVRNGACVFLNKKSRGCMIHSFALDKKLDFYLLKPLFCSIFPLTFNEGVLVTPEEVDDASLVCLGSGPNLYEGARNTLIYYFGKLMVKEIDIINKNYIPTKQS